MDFFIFKQTIILITLILAFIMSLAYYVFDALGMDERYKNLSFRSSISLFCCFLIFLILLV